MECTITEKELKKALKAIRRASRGGFHYCEGVFRAVGFDGTLVKLEYSDLMEKAHPTDGRYNWGRYQGISRNYTFQNGKLINKKDDK